MLGKLREDLHILKDPQKALILQRFFKTGKGEYGEGDVFLGITVPQSRKIALKYKNLPLSDARSLLKSKIHEERLIVTLILVYNFEKGSDESRKKIFEFYLKNTKYINNWDLVDLSAPKIVGEYLRMAARSFPHVASDAQLAKANKSKLNSRSSLNESRHIKSDFKKGGGLALNSLANGKAPRNEKQILLELARSKNLWERRISIIATYQFISKDKDPEWTFIIASILISDKHDLIQKAVGWMLREVGKRISEKTELKFLDKNYKHMGRTALRYSTERFPPSIRVKYLQGKI